MSEAQQGRLGAAAGIVFVVLVILSVIFLGDPPGYNDTPEQVADYMGDNRAEIQVGTALQIVAGVVFLLFLGSLTRVLRIAEERGPGRLAAVAFAGGIITLAFALLAWGLLWTASARGDLDPSLMQALSDAGNFAMVLAIGVGLTTLIGASSAVAHTGRALPRPLAAYGALLALFSIITAAGASFKETGAFSAADGALPSIALLGFLVWVLWTSIVLLRQSGGSGTPAPAQD
jgi:hypothetical protein